MNQQQLLMIFPDMEYDEMATIIKLSQNMTEQQQQTFLSIFQGKRKDRTFVLVLALLGFIGVAGIHRMVVGNIALGILYFFTAGLCFIGTIVDLINIKSITTNYNIKMAFESANMTMAFSK